MKAKKNLVIRSSEITPKELFHARRKFMQLAGGVTLAALLPRAVWAGAASATARKTAIRTRFTRITSPMRAE